MEAFLCRKAFAMLVLVLFRGDHKPLNAALIRSCEASGYAFEVLVSSCRGARTLHLVFSPEYNLVIQPFIIAS